MHNPHQEKILSLLDVRITKVESTVDPGYKELHIMPRAKGLDLWRTPLCAQTNTELWGTILGQIEDSLWSDECQIEVSILKEAFGMAPAGGSSVDEQLFDEARTELEGIVAECVHDYIKELLEAPRPQLSQDAPTLDMDDLDDLWATGRMDPS